MTKIVKVPSRLAEHFCSEYAVTVVKKEFKVSNSTEVTDTLLWELLKKNIAYR